MRIGIVVDNSFFEDIRVTNEAEILAKAGYDLYILCINSKKKNKNSGLEGIVVQTVKVSNFFKDKIKFLSNGIIDFYSFFWAWHIRRFIKKYQIDTIHVHDLYMARSVLIANRNFHKKLILDLHENYPYAVESYGWSKTLLGRIFVSKKRWLKREQKMIPKFDRIIVLSQFYKQDLMRRVGITDDKKFIVFPNFPNIQILLDYNLDHEVIQSENRYHVCYFGGVSERRGIFTLIEAIEDVKEAIPDFKVLIIGPVDKTDKMRFHRFLNDPGFKDSITYYDWKDISLLPTYLFISEIAISPLYKNPHHESGVANKVFQYMLFGKPVIVSDCKPQEEVVLNEKAGLVFIAKSPKDLAKKIILLNKDKNLRDTMGQNGKNAVLTKYNSKLIRDELLKAYDFSL